MEASAETSVRSSRSPSFVITTSWDDGHPMDLRVADLLARHGLSGTFYIPCETGHEVLSARQVRDLAKRFEIGAHTVHHVELTTIPDSAARVEILESKRRLEGTTGTRCKTFCFPRGRFAKRHLKMLSDAGFCGVRTVELLSLDCPKIVDGVAMIPTTVQVYPHAAAAYWRNCARRLRLANLGHVLRIGRHRDWEATAILTLERARERGGVFHLWGHSWEIDDSQQWEPLNRVLALMGQMARGMTCLTNSEVCQYAG